MSNITPEKLAQVAALVAQQKAKSEVEKSKRATVAEKPERSVERQAERAQRRAARQAEKTALRDARAVERAEKKRQRELAKASKAEGSGPSNWQLKIERLRNSLPESTPNLRALAATLTQFSDVELTSALAYVEFERRQRGIRATAALRQAPVSPLQVGDQVRIKNCNARKFIGQVGTVSLVRRIRAFVTVPGFETEAYVFTSDLEVLQSASETGMGVNVLDMAESDSEAHSTGTDG